MADNVIPMPPRLPPSVNGAVDDAADLVDQEAHVAAVFIRDSGRVTVWCSDDFKTPEHWEWIYGRLQRAIDTLHKMQAEARPDA